MTLGSATTRCYGPGMTITIALIMHSTRSDNLGVGALTASQIEMIRSAAAAHGLKARIVILDWPGWREPYVRGPDVEVVEITGRDLVNPRAYLARIRRADLVIDIGAGDSFADIYGTRRMRRLLLMKYLVHAARRPLVVAPQTVGPFTRASSRQLVRRSLEMSRLVATRDRLSTDCVRELGVRRAPLEASDVALRLPYEAPPPRAGSAPVRVGINVSGLLMNGGYTRNNMFGLRADYPALMRTLVDRFRAEGASGRAPCEIHLVSHVISQHNSVEDDYHACLDLARAYGEAGDVVVAPRFETPSEAKSYIAGMDFFMGARMHACIAAFSSGVPVVPMAYSRKFAGLFGTLGYERTVDCTSESNDAIVAKVMAAFADREAVRAEAKAACAVGLEKLARYERALGELMAEIARPRRAAQEAAAAPMDAPVDPEAHPDPRRSLLRRVAGR